MLAAKKKLEGIPRVLGDYSELGAVVTEKIAGLPVQSIIMKAALLPGFADNGSIALVAQRTGEWLKGFHKSTADAPEPFDGSVLISSLEKLCVSCKEEGLDDDSIQLILSGAQNALARNRKSLPSSAVLSDFSPLNVVVTETGVGFCDFAHMQLRGNSFEDLATFLASVEALEKYPFCNRTITGQIQENFINAYGVSQSDARHSPRIQDEGVAGNVCPGPNRKRKRDPQKSNVGQRDEEIHSPGSAKIHVARGGSVKAPSATTKAIRKDGFFIGRESPNEHELFFAFLARSSFLCGLLRLALLRKLEFKLSHADFFAAEFYAFHFQTKALIQAMLRRGWQSCLRRPPRDARAIRVPDSRLEPLAERLWESRQQRQWRHSWKPCRAGFS